MPCRVQMARYKKLEQSGGCTCPITWIGIPECNADAEELKDSVIGDLLSSGFGTGEQVHFVQAGWRDFSACWMVQSSSTQASWTWENIRELLFYL